MRSADNLVYSTNKKQRWRLMEAFEDFLEDPGEDSAENRHHRDYDVTIALKDRVRFSANCRRILHKSVDASSISSTSLSSTYSVKEVHPTSRYTNLETVLDDKSRFRSDYDRDKIKDDHGRERRRVGGRKDEGQLVRTRRKVDGHARRCNCERCVGQPDTAQWRANTEVDAVEIELADQGRQHAQQHQPQRFVDEVRYVMELPIQKRLVKKRGVTCDSYSKAENVIVKGVRKSGKSASALAEELEMKFEDEEEDVEEEEREEEFEDFKEDLALIKAEENAEFSLVDWMLSERDYPTPEEARRSPVVKPKYATIVADDDTGNDNRPHVRYVDPPEIPQNVVKVKPCTDVRMPSTRVSFTKASVVPQHLQSVFSGASDAQMIPNSMMSYFEADSLPRSFVVDISTVVESRLVEEQLESFKRAFTDEGRKLTPITIEEKPRKKKYRIPYSNYYLQTPNPSMAIREVKCFLAFTELVGKSETDVEQERDGDSIYQPRCR